MTMSLRTKLSLAFVLITVTLVLSIGVLANFLLEKNFREYVIENQKKKNTEVVMRISQQYTDSNKWRMDVIEAIGISSLEEGLILKIKGSQGDVIWDATQHNSGLCQQMIYHMARNMMSRYPNWQGGYVVDEYPVMRKLTQVGSVEIGYYGPFYFTDSDLHFINDLNIALLWITLFALTISLLFAAVISKKLSLPITRVIHDAQMIAKGDYTLKSAERSNTKEIRDLTAAVKDLAKTLEVQENLRKRLTADVAHELRTPMTTLQSHIEAMVDGIWKPTVERLKSCHEEIIRVNKMIGDLHLLAKFEGEQLPLNQSTFDVGDMIHSIIINFQGQFRNKGINIEYTQRKQMIHADPDKMRQVLVNLLSNALKYTPKEGKVFVDVESNKDMVEIIVKDTGQGIGQEDLPYIFERFYRADKSRNRMTGGSGVGLTIAKAIAEAHGGRIEVKSEMNIGTEFKVILPK
ncbi:ATP-binding protein [Petroclostridium sp. X23]|uniref:sensor histidine kinase n=1 Tax=Petroclostridium sp. X23 TaxID=3045146 RepID=UPI0024AD0813|nr:ATP-binding protein [Petroclostridium sp. X23]WHH61537.1 ATP-binding protein [Petroclostridium sp. X23]